MHSIENLCRELGGARKRLLEAQKMAIALDVYDAHDHIDEALTSINEALKEANASQRLQDMLGVEE